MVLRNGVNQLHARLEDYKNAIGVYIIGGIIINILSIFFWYGFEYFFEAIFDGFPPSQFIWTFVILIGIVFFINASKFLTTPSLSTIRSLTTTLYVFIVAWIGSLIYDLVYNEGIYPSTIIAIGLAFGGVLLMNQFITKGKLLLTYLANPQMMEAPQPQYGGFSSSPNDDRLQKLERLANLRDRGAITEEEYQKEKSKLI